MKQTFAVVLLSILVLSACTQVNVSYDGVQEGSKDSVEDQAPVEDSKVTLSREDFSCPYGGDLEEVESEEGFHFTSFQELRDALEEEVSGDDWIMIRKLSDEEFIEQVLDGAKIVELKEGLYWCRPPRTFTPEKCGMNPPFACTDMPVLSEGDNKIYLSLQNAAGTGVYAKVSISGCTGQSAEEYVRNGDPLKVVIACDPSLISKNKRFEESIKVEYRKEGESRTHVAYGEISVTVR